MAAVSPRKLRVLLVDDDPRFIDTLRALLDTDERVEVVGTAANGDAAIREAAALQPDHWICRAAIATTGVACSSTSSATTASS